MDRPRARLLWPGGEIGLQAERVKADARQLVEARLALPHRGEQLFRFGLRKVDKLALDLCVEEDRLGRRNECGECSALRRVRQDRLVDIEHVEDRLRGEEAELLDEREIDRGR